MGSPETNTTIDLPIDYTPKNIPIEKIIKYRKQGLSINEIGDLVGISKQAVYQRLQPYLHELDTLEDYKTHRADIIALKGKEILKHLDSNRLEKASAYQLAGMYGILYDKERLERGESTQNVASVHGDIESIRALKLGKTTDQST